MLNEKFNIICPVYMPPDHIDDKWSDAIVILEGVLGCHWSRFPKFLAYGFVF